MPLETERGYVVTLSIAQRAVLVMLAERGRRQSMNPTTFSKPVADGLADMETKGLIHITKLIGSVMVEYELTDLGAQVVDQIYASQKQSSELAEFINKTQENKE